MRVQRVRPSERFFVTPFFESTAPTLNRHVRDLMATDILATSPDATPYEVAQAMLQERIDLLPVVDRDLKVVGVMSEADLLNRVNFPHGTILDGLKALFGRGNHRVEKSTANRIGDLMTRSVQTISPDETLQDAAEIMVTKGVRGLPVVDKDGHLIGMLTRRHVIQGMLQWSERETPT
ncbi:Choline transport ATP-binding protein OpuBA [compost metagenome]